MPGFKSDHEGSSPLVQSRNDFGCAVSPSYCVSEPDTSVRYALTSRVKCRVGYSLLLCCVATQAPYAGSDRPDRGRYDTSKFNLPGISLHPPFQN